MAAVTNSEAALLLQTGGLPDANLRTTVAHVNLGTVVRQAPTFALVIEKTKTSEGGLLVHEPDLGSPSQLNDLLVYHGDPLAEKFPRQADLLHYLAGFHLHFAQG